MSSLDTTNPPSYGSINPKYIEENREESKEDNEDPTPGSPTVYVNIRSKTIRPLKLRDRMLHKMNEVVTNGFFVLFVFALTYGLYIFDVVVGVLKFDPVNCESHPDIAKFLIVIGAIGILLNIFMVSDRKYKKKAETDLGRTLTCTMFTNMTALSGVAFVVWMCVGTSWFLATDKVVCDDLLYQSVLINVTVFWFFVTLLLSLLPVIFCVAFICSFIQES